MHPQQPHFKLSRQAVLLGIISAAYPMMSYGVTAGKADFVIGNVVIVAADGNRRVLSKGSEINTGDAINTSAGARAQLRFLDGGFVSLQPNTQFRVDEYNYQNKTDGSEKSFFSLLKGGFRAITGAIGHLNRNNYKVATPSATIGIRGTGYKAEIRDDGLLVSVGEGAILLSNNAGALVVSSGGAAFVANMNTSPAPSSEQPHTPPASIQPLTNPSAILTQPALPKLTSGGGYVLAHAYYNQVGPVGGKNKIDPANAIFNDLGQLTKYTDSSGQGGALGAANVTFATTDGIIGWGRWDGYTDPAGTLPGALSPGVFHYVIGLPTAVMPTTGSATYSLMGYTNPTATDGSTGWSVTGSLAVADFNNIAATNGMSINMTVSNSSTSLNINDLNISGGSTFAATPATTCTGTCSASGYSTSIFGFFAGENAQRLGISYNITDNMTQNIQGVAAFSSSTQ